MSKDNAEGISPSAKLDSMPDEVSEVPSENQMAFLQQIYQQGQMELLTEFQRAQASLTMQMQQLNCFQILQQMQQQRQQQQQAGSRVIQAVPSSISNGPDNPLESETQQMSPSSRSEGHSSRVRRSLHRSLSGSGQTISQTTRDRLKNMIASKKNKNRSEASCSSTSQMSESASWSQSLAPNSSSSASWLNADSSSKQAVTGSATSTTSVPAITVAVSSPHYEPYPLPTTVHANRGSLPPEHQLRKVNSEPNLKMRIRAKLLNKGSSPVQAHQNSAFTYPHSTLERSESDIPMDTGPPLQVSLDQSSSLAPTHLLQSPSLPNLIGSQLQLEMSALLAQAQFSPFFSMPSLYKNSILPGCSAWNTGTSDSVAALSEGCARSAGKFDSRGLSSSVPVGGYQSLLKQQIRDLVLRRKSLVREEPEDEAVLEAQLLSRLTNGGVINVSDRIPNSSQGKTGLVYDSTMAKHQCICGDNKRHVEHGGRVHSIWARLQERGLVDRCERIVIRKATLEMLRTMHSYNYVTFFALSPTAFMKADNSQIPVKSFVQLPCGGLGVDTDTYFNDMTTPSAIKIAVGSLVELASQVAEGKLRNGFACIRPPGHHAEYDQAMGFCFFNNVAIAVKHLQQRYREECPRIAIIDWDVHHGNGTQSLFEADSSVLYLSLHRHDNGNFFPGTGAVTEVGTGAGKGFTVNIPFSGDAMSDADYLAAWRVVVMPILECFQPSFIMVSAGFDAARGHSAALGGYNLSPQIFGYFTRQLMNYAGGRVVLALEGGYDLAAISDSAEECVKILCGDSDEAGKLSLDALNSIPKLSAQEAIQKAVAIHKRHWPLLSGAQGIGISELHWQTISQRFATLTV